jgi:hypothetical protein
MQNKMNLFVFYAEVQLITYRVGTRKVAVGGKDNANRMQNKMNFVHFFMLRCSLSSLSAAKIMQEESRTK